MRTRNALLPVPWIEYAKGTLVPVISEDPTTTAEPTMRKGRHTPYCVRPEQIAAMTDMYPGHLTWRRTFPGIPGQIREARRFVAFLLADAACREDAELIVSELATNAVSHTSSGHPHGTFVVEVVRAATRVRIAVYDCGWGGTPPIPTPRPPHPNALNGRGLAIVAALATEVGFEGSDDIGHVVWAELSTAPTGADAHREA
jgi:serine/threonine-protein kinase RsbW